jgi:hypothetical protein
MWEEKEMCLFQLECVFILIICQNHLNTVLHIKGITWSRLIHHISNWHTHTHFEITYITSTTCYKEKHGSSENRQLKDSQESNEYEMLVKLRYVIKKNMTRLKTGR